MQQDVNRGQAPTAPVTALPGEDGGAIVPGIRRRGEVAGPKSVGLSARATWELVARSLAGYKARLGVIGALSGLGAAAEAATVAAIVGLVSALSAADGLAHATLFGRDLALPVRTLFLVAFALLGARTLVQLAGAVLSARLSHDYEAARRRRLFEGFIDAAWGAQADEKVGRLQELLTSGVAVSMRVLGALTTGFTSAFSFLVLLGAALLVDPASAGLIVAMAIAIFVGLRPLALAARRHAFEKADLNLVFAHEVSQAVAGAREIRVFDVGDAVKRKVAALVRTIRDKRVVATGLAQVVPALYQNLSAGLIVVGMLVVWATDSGLASLGVVVILLLRALSYSQQLQQVYQQVSEGVPYLLQGETFERRYRDAVAAAGSAPLDRIDTVTFDGVDFAYRPGEPTLQGVSFRVARGEIVGIVGPSGSGKSTVTQILLRLRAPAAGRYLVNDRPVVEFAAAAWSRKVSFVPQEPQLVDGSVYDNIVFLRDGATRELVERAAKLAHVHDDILALPRGYDTAVGDRGAQLSGGQRQRVCIARALLFSPELVVFDEPTSALDVHSEQAIQRALGDLRGRATLFIIAHRLSTLSICDRIMVLRGGAVQSFGAPAELQRTDAYYAEALRLSGLVPA